MKQNELDRQFSWVFCVWEGAFFLCVGSKKNPATTRSPLPTLPPSLPLLCSFEVCSLRCRLHLIFLVCVFECSDARAVVRNGTLSSFSFLSRPLPSPKPLPLSCACPSPVFLCFGFLFFLFLFFLGSVLSWFFCVLKRQQNTPLRLCVKQTRNNLYGQTLCAHFFLLCSHNCSTRTAAPTLEFRPAADRRNACIRVVAVFVPQSPYRLQSCLQQSCRGGGELETFADDINFAVQGFAVGDIVRRAQRLLDIIDAWSRRAGIPIGSLKATWIGARRRAALVLRHRRRTGARGDSAARRPL